MTVRIQVINVYDIEVPGNCEDPIAYAYGMQTAEIQEIGTLIGATSEYAELLDADPRLGGDF